MDYAKSYNDYWSAADRLGSHSFADGPALAREILDLCGSGSVLDVGAGMGLLVRSLLREGIEACGVDVSDVAVAYAQKLAPGRFHKGSILALPFPDDSFDIVISTDCLEHIAEADIPTALAELRRVSRRFVYLRLATTQDRDNHWHLTVRPREWWEMACHEIGFRKHPAYLRANAYEALEHDGWQISIPLEKIPEEALRAYPLASLKAERDLHMDMFRETGRRSEAHIVRYHLAASLVRPGDVVLDATCGLGYGSHLLHTASPAGRILGVDGSRYAIDYARVMYGATAGAPEFQQGLLPECLATLPDNSVDLIASFETLEHVSDPVALLAEFRRVLTPGGRIVTSVPLDWTEADGKDPNPFHLHVYDWNRIYREVSAAYFIERVFAQSASRRKTGSQGARSWETTVRSLQEFSPVSLREGTAPDCEWCVLVGMRDPLDGSTIPYSEKEYPLASLPEGWNTTAFARDYQNPWLVRSLVTIGRRAADPGLRARIAESVLSASDDLARSHADKGAALCVTGYALLEHPASTAVEIDAFAARCKTYLDLKPASTHALRWQISIRYLLGRLGELRGDFPAALASYEACTHMDALAFNPVLATKTVESCLRAGILHHAAAHHDAAKSSWKNGIRLANQALAQDWSDVLASLDHPMDFALPELAAVVEHASACAYALDHIDNAAIKPCEWWWQHRRDRLNQLTETRRTLARYSATDAEIARLNQVIVQKDLGLEQQAREIHRLEKFISEKQSAIQSMADHIQPFRELVIQNESKLQAKTHEIHRLYRVLPRASRCCRSLRALAAGLLRLFGHGSKRAMVWNIEVPADFTHASAAGKISGWVFSKQTNDPVLAVRLSYECRVFSGTIHLPRPDVHAIHPVAGPLAGFEIDYDFSGLSSSTAPIKIESLDQNGDWRVLTNRTLQFKRGSATDSPSLAPYIVRHRSPARADRPRILHAMANFMVGGSSRLVVDLIEHLGSEYQQSVLTSHAPNTPAYVGVEITEIKRAAGSEAIIAHFKKVRPSFIHVHYWGDIDEPWYALIFTAATQLDIPVVQNINTPVAPFTAPCIHHNIYVSETVRREFGNTPGKFNTEVIYPGSDFSHFTRPAGEEPPENCIGMVYRLEIDKLNADAIQPFIHCVMQRPATRVLIVGGGSLLEGFQSAVAKAGLSHAFEFTGYVPYQELPALYKRMSLFVAPVWKESFGQVSPFAMHMRVPVVGYDAGAIHEIIDDRSLLAPAGDAVVLGNLMASLLDDRPRRLAIGMRNAARASKLFSLESMIARYRDLYARVPCLTP